MTNPGISGTSKTDRGPPTQPGPAARREEAAPGREHETGSPGAARTKAGCQRGDYKDVQGSPEALSLSHLSHFLIHDFSILR